MKIHSIYNNVNNINRYSSSSAKEAHNTVGSGKNSRTTTPCDFEQKYFYTPAISFGNNNSPIQPDEDYFNIENADVFSINFFNDIHKFLTDYKEKTPIENSRYFLDNSAENNINVTGNVSLLDEASAKSISAQIVDLYGHSKANKVVSDLHTYLFGNSSAEEVGAKRIYLNDNSHSDKNKAEVVWLKDNAIADSIESQNVYQRNFSFSNDVNAANFSAKDFAVCKKLNGQNITLKDNSKIDEAFTQDGQIALYNNSQIENLTVNNSKITLNKDTRIDYINSETDLSIVGNGSIGDIDVNGSHLYIMGPVKINGKINFTKPNGVVIVQKGKQNIFSKINSSMVENGILQFLIQNKNDMYLGNPQDTFSSGLESLNQSIEKISGEDIPVLTRNKNYISAMKENVEVKNSYEEFYKNYLQSLVSPKGRKSFSLFWVKNAKLGNERVSDLWMKFLNADDKNLPDSQKTYKINNLTPEQKVVLLEKTTDYWFENVLPEAQKVSKFSDFEIFKSNLKEIENIIEIMKMSPTDDEYAKNINNISNLKLGDKPLLDFWLDAIKSEDSKNIGTERLKKEQYYDIISDKNNRKKIIKTTVEELEKQKNFISTYEYSCSDLAKNEPNLDKLQLNLLEKYKNSEVFYQLIFEAAKGVNNRIEIEKQIIKTLQALSKEHNQLAIDARKNIFSKTLDVPQVVKAKPNTDLNNYTNFVFSSLVQNVNCMKADDFSDFSSDINAFKNFVNINSYFLGDYWQSLVKTAYQFYKTKMLGDITDNNVKLLYSVNKSLRNIKPSDKNIQEILQSNQLDTIEQKDFVVRYKDNFNFKKLINNNGIDLNNTITDLLMIEALNESLYQNRLDLYSQNITPESVKENLDLTDKYLVLLDKDYADMSISEKYRAVLKIPVEEFLFMNKIILKDWKANELKKFMGEKFNQINLNHNINSQSKNIVEQLNLINTNLNEIKIELSGQSYSLSEIISDLDKLVDISKKSFKELYFIGENVEAINNNTQSIKANTKAVLYATMQNSKFRDPELSKTIEDLLPQAEKLPFSEFLKVIEKKHKALRDEKQKKQLKSIATLATIAVAASTAGTIEPTTITNLLGSGEIVQKSIPVMKSIADTLKHVAIFKVATTSLNK